MNRLYATSLILTSLFAPHSSAQATASSAECSPSTPLHAQYEIQNKRRQNSQSLELWRADKKSAIHYPATQMTESWEPTANQGLHLIRYFERHQRGIEYQPEDIKTAPDWSEKWQLVSDRLIAQMHLVGETGRGCGTVAHYQYQLGDAYIRLQWMPKQKLVKRFEIQSFTKRERWTLLSIDKDAKKIEQKFAALEDYYLTDYIDIGDNESDPFLLKMMNLGFIEHGSGFYDQYGHNIGQSHRH